MVCGKDGQRSPPLVLRDLCQLEYRDIATHLGLPPGTVKSHVRDARAQVQQALGERHA